MADWTNIANTALQPGAPVRSIDGVALRDNPIAIAEGAAGAPRVQTNGIQDGAVTNAKIANSAVDNVKIANSAVNQSKIAGSSVGTGQLKTNTTSISGTECNFTTVSLGAYAFVYNAGNSNSITRVTIATGAGGSADVPRLRVENTSDFNCASYNIQWRRVIG